MKAEPLRHRFVTQDSGLRTQDSSGLRTQDFWLLAALTVAVAATRFAALSRSIWDWDEALFCLAMRDYNVVFHHPHPPGFPLFVGAAKLVRLVVHDDFHALRAVSLIASLFVFPALYALGRALRFPFRTSVVAALLFSFLPNVWYWGGTAFSDVFAIVLFLFGAALMLRESRAAYLAGSVLFAATLLVRPQNVLLAYPWLLASWRRLRARRAADVVVSAAAITVIVLGGYALAARATGGWKDYIGATLAHQRYVATVDGALNPHRPPPMAVLGDFAVDPFLAGRTSVPLAIFAVAALLRPRRRDLDAVATFAPNFLLAWLMLSVTGISRLSLGYIPMHALLAADGMGNVADLLARRRERVAVALQSIFAAAIIGRYVYWAWPALREVRAHDSPPVAAVHWIVQHVPRATGKVYVQSGMVPFADYYLSGYKSEEVPEAFDPAKAPEEPSAVWLADRVSPAPRAVNFERPRRRLWALFNRRYFGSSVVPVVGGPRWMAGGIEFADGWYPPELDEKGRAFRWMGARSRMLLQPLPPHAQLSMQLYAPIDAEPPPVVTVVFNDRVVEQFRASEAYLRKTYELDSRDGRTGELVIGVDRVVNPARMGNGGDARDLGLRVSGVDWKALAP